MSDVEETIKRIQSQKGVVGVIVMDSAGKFVCSFLILKFMFSFSKFIHWHFLFDYISSHPLF
ncbi:unnamed protein product [Strongylus vulgaris]|uniref:Roadblock/LAMTOR2 domain-containing protein n=1 Tax=Strongylus vulgaris TaxID=40348 RepID=A0A3P7JJN1_STRVU|nr:unnamed protein product [Strongylus vulgaris]